MLEVLKPSKVWQFIILVRKEGLEMEAEKSGVEPKTQTSSKGGVVKEEREKKAKDPERKQAVRDSLASFQFQEIQQTRLRLVKNLKIKL